MWHTPERNEEIGNRNPLKNSRDVECIIRHQVHKKHLHQAYNVFTTSSKKYLHQVNKKVKRPLNSREDLKGENLWRMLLEKAVL